MNKQNKLSVLSKVRSMIKSEHEMFICCALASIKDCEEAKYLKDKIQSAIDPKADSLFGCCPVETWLKDNHSILYRKLEKGGLWVEYRLAWIDEMTKQVKAGQL